MRVMLVLMVVLASLWVIGGAILFASRDPDPVAVVEYNGNHAGSYRAPVPVLQ